MPTNLADVISRYFERDADRDFAEELCKSADREGDDHD